MGRKKEGSVKRAPSVAALILASVVGAWSADIIVDGAPLYFTAQVPAPDLRAVHDRQQPHLYGPFLEAF